MAPSLFLESVLWAATLPALWSEMWCIISPLTVNTTRESKGLTFFIDS